VSGTAGLIAAHLMVEDWRATRAELAALERAEHPDITDRRGRVWIWSSGDLYHHDGLLGFPKALIADLGLPSPRLVDNPNYAGLCDVCRSEWPS
jgi:hypothetical protein